MASRADENPVRMGFALLFLFLLPWMLIFSRAGGEICTVAIGILFLWRSAALHDWQWLRDPFVRVALLAWVWLMLGVSPFALNPEKSFLLALPWIRYILLFVAMRYWLLTTGTALRAMLAVLVLLLLFCATDTLWQYSTGISLTQHPVWDYGRLTGPFSRPKIGIFMARFLLPIAALLVVVVAPQSRRVGASCFLVVLVFLAVILFSGERTAFVMSMGALGFVSLVVALCVKQRRFIAVTLMSTLLLVMAVLFYTQPAVQNTIARAVGHVENFSHSPYGQVFTAAFNAGRAHWITGVGMQGLRELTPEPDGSGAVDMNTIHEHFLHAHNPYLEWFAEAGLVGLLLFITLVATLLCEAWQLLQRVRGPAVAVPAFMLAACLFHFFPAMSTQSYFSNWTGIMVWYCLAITFSMRAALTPDDYTASDRVLG